MQIHKSIAFINRMKENNDMMVSINTEKASDKIQFPFTTKTLNKLGIRENHLDTVKSIFEKPSATIILKMVLD